jgi:hypothetical protein
MILDHLSFCARLIGVSIRLCAGMNLFNFRRLYRISIVVGHLGWITDGMCSAAAYHHGSDGRQVYTTGAHDALSQGTTYSIMRTMTGGMMR